MEPSLGLFGGRRGRIAIGLQARTAITDIWMDRFVLAPEVGPRVVRA
jgi:hypothetical protein